MNLLILSTSSNNTPAFIGSLECLNEHQISVIYYDRKWHETAIQMIQANPSFQEQLQTRQARIPRDRCAMDNEILMEAKLSKPDVIIYISAWQEDFLPLNETLGELNSIAPLVHFLSDGADPPWWPKLQEFERRGTFSLTVNIDGSFRWPGGCFGPPDVAPIKKCLTLLTPIDMRHYGPNSFAYGERPYAIGYAGNNGGHFRSVIVQRLQGVRGFAFKQRDNHPQSYPTYAEFLRHCRVSVSVPFSGTGAATQVKGRVLETGFAGACLLEWRNEATRAWFTPRYHFWEYGSIEECAEMAEWLSAHPKIAGETAATLTECVLREHHPATFWRKIFEALGK